MVAGSRSGRCQLHPSLRHDSADPVEQDFRRAVDESDDARTHQVAGEAIVLAQTFGAHGLR
jgi:hypothetical protein